MKPNPKLTTKPPSFLFQGQVMESEEPIHYCRCCDHLFKRGEFNLVKDMCHNCWIECEEQGATD